jgi:hypothetical protein
VYLRFVELGGEDLYEKMWETYFLLMGHTSRVQNSVDSKRSALKLDQEKLS